MVILGSPIMGQVTYPGDYIIQDVNWTSGTHDVTSSQKIISPSSPSHPVAITGTAAAEFVSAKAVELMPGFQAGPFVPFALHAGPFIARIDNGLGNPDDVIAIAPDPTTHVIDNVMHVNKWEKLEIGMLLPQAYQDAIDSFFVHYYSNHVSNDATPGHVDAVHDLNPYADDSLQLVMTLTSPSGAQKMKWGFYMREAKWNGLPTDSVAKLVTNTFSALTPYHIHFRFAPDEVGLWQFSLSIQAPHTITVANAALPSLLYSGYGFACDPPLEDNHGSLHVNTANRRTLQFEDSTAFFGLGTNMAGCRHGDFGPSSDWNPFYRRDFQVMQKSMEQLHGVGGNYMRLWLSEHTFTPEWVNLGVYDAYHTPPTCSNGGGNFPYDSNCQYLCWAFDSILGTARANDLYIQLCIDPNYPGADLETFGWGANPYVIQYLNTLPRPYDVKNYFYAGGDTTVLDSGVFYYWKRKYKYIMARWGYSVNLAAIEPFNEIDQMLGYQEHNLTNSTLGGLCPETKVLWPVDPDLPGTVNQWLTDIMAYVRDPVDPEHPATSPLGEDKMLFLMSYTDRYRPDDPETPTGFFQPFNNPKLDIVDVHRGLYWGDDVIRNSYGLDSSFHAAFHPSGVKKPFHNGEYEYVALKDMDGDPSNGQEYNSGKVFDNYDVSFHNEIWASTFFGNFTAGTSWEWDRVFWWPDALPLPLSDAANPYFATHPPTNVIWETNYLKVGNTLVATPVQNRPVYHNFKPLADLLSNPDLQAYNFFSGDFSPHEVFDDQNKMIECYYLVNNTGSMAIGWVHNVNAYWENHYYITHKAENFLGCESPPGPQSISLPGFAQDHGFQLTWYPTRINGTVPPPANAISTMAGEVTLDLSEDPLHGIVNNYLDTLHSDYAFILTPSVIEHRSMILSDGSTTVGPNWDFVLSPNPADDMLNLLLPDDGSSDIAIFDLSGRRVLSWDGVSGPLVNLSIEKLSAGAYSVRVIDGAHSKVKELVIR